MTFNDNSSKVSNSISYSEKKEIDAKLKTLNEAVASLQDTTAEHTETLDNITSGNGETVIPIGAGGTGQTDAVSDRNALLNNLPEEVDAVTDDTLIAGVYPDTDITSGKLSKRKMSLVWNYFKQKLALENIGTGSDIARSASDPTTIAETFNNIDSVLEEVQKEIEYGVTSDDPTIFTYNGYTYYIGTQNDGTPVISCYNSYRTGADNLKLTITGWQHFYSSGELAAKKGLSSVLTEVLANLWLNYMARGAANGIATLDANGKLLASQLPANSRQIVGEIDTSTIHTLPDVSGYNSGNELIVTGAGYYIQNTAFTLAAGKTLTDMEVAQANKLIAAGYVFTLYEGTTELGTVSAFATTKVTLTDSTEVALPYSAALSATSTPSTVQVDTKVGDEIIALDGHWILLASDTDVSELTKKIETIEKVIPDDATESNQLTTESTVNSALTGLVPVGAIQAGLFTSAPSGWLLCDGQTEYSRTTYAELWNLLKNIDECKGDGSTTFTTPDLRGRFLQGYTADNSVGTSMAAGLPDIQGTTVATDTAFSGSKGALKSSGNNGMGVWVGTTSQNIGNNVTIKASDGETKLDGTLQNDVYGKSDTVQPPALCVNYIIKY